jgi:Putative adhesin
MKRASTCLPSLCAFFRVRTTCNLAFACAMLLLSAVPTFAAENQEDSRQQAAMASGGSVSIENGRGDLWLEGTDQSEIVVEAHKVFEGGSEADRERWMRETQVRLEGDEHHRIVRVDYPHEFDFGMHWGYTHRAVNLTIHIPRQANGDLKTDRGKVNVRRIAGKLDLSTDRGDVDVNDCDGELRVHGDRGRLTVSETAIRSGLRVNFDRGDVDLRLTSFAGDSDIDLDRGNLTLRLPAKSAFTLDLDRSRRSTFRTDFPVLSHGSYRSDHLRGDVNGGGPVLRIRGDRGNVSLQAGQ